VRRSCTPKPASMRRCSAARANRAASRSSRSAVAGVRPRSRCDRGTPDAFRHVCVARDAAAGLIAVAYVYVVIRRAHVMAQPAHDSQRKLDAHVKAPIDRFGITLVVASTAVRFLTTAAFMTYLPNLLAARGAPSCRPANSSRHFARRHHRDVSRRLFGRPAGFGYRIGRRAGGGGAVPPRIFLYSGTDCDRIIAARQRLALGAERTGVVIVQSLLPRNLGMALGLINGVAFERVPFWSRSSGWP